MSTSDTDSKSGQLNVPKSPLKLEGELSTLKVKRSSIKGQITLFKNYLNEIGQPESLTTVDINKLNLKITRFLELSSSFDQLQSRIEVLNPNNLEIELSERNSIEENLQFSIATAQDMLETYHK